MHNNKDLTLQNLEPCHGEAMINADRLWRWQAIGREMQREAERETETDGEKER